MADQPVSPPSGSTALAPPPAQQPGWPPAVKFVDAVKNTPEIKEIVVSTNAYLDNVSNVFSAEDNPKTAVPETAVVSWSYQKNLSGNGKGKDPGQFLDLGSRLQTEFGDLQYQSKGRLVQAMYAAVEAQISAAEDLTADQKKNEDTKYRNQIDAIRDAAKKDIITRVNQLNGQFDKWNSAYRRASPSGAPELKVYDSAQGIVLRLNITLGLYRLVKFVHDRVISADKRMHDVSCQIICRRPSRKPRAATKPAHKPQNPKPPVPPPVQQPAPPVGQLPAQPPAPQPPQQPPAQPQPAQPGQPYVIRIPQQPQYYCPPVFQPAYPVMTAFVPIFGFAPIIPFYGLIQRQYFPAPWCGTVLRSYAAPWLASPWYRTWVPQRVFAADFGSWCRPLALPAFPDWAPVFHRYWDGYGATFSRGFSNLSYFRPYRWGPVVGRWR